MNWELGIAGWGLAAVLFVALIAALRMHAARMSEKETEAIGERLLNEAAFRYLRKKIEELGG